ncbi:MAG: radical SAM family heme chaperone HemW [Gemmatimonadota bacterium]
MHVYVHVPFCARRCSYCDFAIAVRRVTPHAAFVAAIRAEWAQRAADPAWRAAPGVATLYFGGGTPSRLDPAALGTVIAMLRADHSFDPDIEITLEANPEDVTDERAAAWVTVGINRVSLGVQTFDPAVLEWMHRTHRAEQVPAAVAALRAAGISNVSMDLIFGVPTDLRRDWQRDLDLTLALEPTHLSLYGLTVEPHTPLQRWTDRGDAIPVDEERYATEYLAANRALVAHGLEHYEVSNAGLPGRHSRHNRAYWSGVDYLGLGPSAHSYLGGVRAWNVREWAEFSDRAMSGAPLQAGAEVLDAAARRLEQRYLGLRTTTGLPVSELPAEACAAWVGAGWAEVDQGQVRLTIEGWLRLDALVAAIVHS